MLYLVLLRLPAVHPESFEKCASKNTNFVRLWLFHVQVLRKFMRSVLNLADGQNRQSLALPAVGTGGLQIPSALVAGVMYNEIAEFSKSHPNTTLKDIRIVVYPKNRQTVTVKSTLRLG